MTSLTAAWEWYTTARKLLLAQERFGRRFWLDPGVQALIEKDNILRFVGRDDIVGGTAGVLDPLNDLAVLVLFSVFEATVRDELIAQLRSETPRVTACAMRVTA